MIGVRQNLWRINYGTVPPPSTAPVAKNIPDVSKLLPRENVSPNGEGQIN